MNLDHIAFRVGRDIHAISLLGMMGYKETEEFDLRFDDGSVVRSHALESPFEGSPEIFVSAGEKGSIVRNWVDQTGGGIHHLAFRVDDVAKTMNLWRRAGIEFTTDEPIECPEDNLIQAFTKPLDNLGGIIIELIHRTDKGFCAGSVKKLMESTKDEN